MNHHNPAETDATNEHVRTRRAKLLAARLTLVAILAALLLTGCGKPEEPWHECLDVPLARSNTGLVIAIAVHEGAPAPDLPATLLPTIEGTLAANQPVRIIGIDGTPNVELVDVTPLSDATCDAYRTTLGNASNNVVNTIVNTEADSDGNDLFNAIGLAADTADALPDGAQIVIVDSGLADRGPLDFTKPGMTRTDPEAAAAYAAQASATNALKGQHIKLMLGYTAPPQEPLSATERDNVITVWAHALTALGATVTTASTPRPATGPTTSYNTDTSPVADDKAFTPPVAPTGTTGGAPNEQPATAIYHEDQVRFRPDSTDLADPEAAAAALSDVSKWLRLSPDNSITITGTTASAGTEAGRLRLSKLRAESIRQLLLAGPGSPINPAQIETEGVGTHFADFVNDRLPDGALDPLTAPANRTVRITPHQDEPTT